MNTTYLCYDHSDLENRAFCTVSFDDRTYEWCLFIHSIVNSLKLVQDLVPLVFSHFHWNEMRASITTSLTLITRLNTTPLIKGTHCKAYKFIGLLNTEASANFRSWEIHSKCTVNSTFDWPTLKVYVRHWSNALVRFLRGALCFKS